MSEILIIHLVTSFSKAIEEKYAVQKAVVVKMEEHILELTQNQAAVTSPESEKTSK